MDTAHLDFTRWVPTRYEFSIELCYGASRTFTRAEADLAHAGADHLSFDLRGDPPSHVEAEIRDLHLWAYNGTCFEAEVLHSALRPGMHAASATLTSSNIRGFPELRSLRLTAQPFPVK